MLKTFCSVSHLIFSGLIGLIGFGFVIAFHELGHFLFCKLFSIRTPSFSIGFGPRLLTKKIGGTEFALSAIPLGGYVEIAGAAETGQGEQKDAFAKDEHSFSQKPYYQKLLVMIGGILFNLIFSYTVISLLFMAGMPKTNLLYPTNTLPIVAKVKPESPADKAGIVAGDTILAVNGIPITQTTVPTLLTELQSLPNMPATLRIERNKIEQDINFIVEAKQFMGKTIGSAGIVLTMQSLPGLPFLSAWKSGIKLTNKLLVESLRGLRHIFSSGDTTMMAGPVKILSATMQGAQEGIKTLLLFLAFISLSLAMLNLLPIPILDGGQILFYTIEALVGKPLPERIREIIHIACWIGFLILIVFLTYQDLRDLIGDYVLRFLTFVGIY